MSNTTDGNEQQAPERFWLIPSRWGFLPQATRPTKSKGIEYVRADLASRAALAAVGGDEIPWSVVQERAGTDVMTIAMDSKAGRLTASGLMEAIASYAESAYRVGYAAASSPLPAEPEGEREK